MELDVPGPTRYCARCGLAQSLDVVGPRPCYACGGVNFTAIPSERTVRCARYALTEADKMFLRAQGIEPD